MFGLKFTEDIPFHEVYIHGLVRDSEGQKMSKSKGNILDPLDLIDGIDLESLLEKRTTGLMQPELAPKIESATRQQFPDGIPAYGTDALRFTFARLATQGRDIRFDLGTIDGYRKFCNKLWNAARFVMMNTQQIDICDLSDYQPETTAEKWILSELNATTTEIERAVSVYRFDLASKQLYEFIWNEYCAWFIEISKIMLRQNSLNPTIDRSLRQSLLFVLDASVRLLHPFMPFITEEIWQRIHSENHGRSIMFEPYAADLSSMADAESSKEINWLKSIVTAIRNLRSEMNIKPGRQASAFFENASDSDVKNLRRLDWLVRELAQLKSFERMDSSTKKTDVSSTTFTALVGDMRILLAADDLGDVAERTRRLEKDIAITKTAIRKSESKLSNQQFLTRAPAKIVEKEKLRLSTLQKSLSEIRFQLEKLNRLLSGS